MVNGRRALRLNSDERTSLYKTGQGWQRLGSRLIGGFITCWLSWVLQPRSLELRLLSVRRLETDSKLCLPRVLRPVLQLDAKCLKKTALTADNLELFGVFSSAEPLTVSNGDELQLVHVAYLTGEVSGTLQADAESLELRYFPLDALPENLFTPSADLFTAIQKRFAP